MENNNFNPAISFGKVNNITKEFIEGRTTVGEKAYEAYHLNLLLNEIIETRNYSDGEIPRADRNNFIRILIEFSLSQEKNLVLSELGSSLMEIIDGFELVKKIHFPNLSENQIPEFCGIEKSDFLNEVAKLIHPNNNFKLFSKIDDFNNYKVDNKKFSVLIDRAVSSYAFENNIEFSKFIKKFDIAFLQIFAFKNKERVVNDTIGTNLTYFNLFDLKSKLVNLYHLYGFRRPTRPNYLAADQNCIEGFYIYFSNNKVYKAFKDIFLKSSTFKDYFQGKKDFSKNLNDIKISNFF